MVLDTTQLSAAPGVMPVGLVDGPNARFELLR
jgi:hypothetical protein